MTDGGLGLYTRRLNRLPDGMAVVRETLQRNTSLGMGDADSLQAQLQKVTRAAPERGKRTLAAAPGLKEQHKRGGLQSLASSAKKLRPID
ncbi:UNVERIFIED_CONTAM: hypothetical protein K2H54_056670 [Gekko kuhli]